MRLPALIVLLATLTAGCASDAPEATPEPQADAAPPTPTERPSLSLTSQGALRDGTKSYVVAAAKGLVWGPPTSFILGGTPLTYADGCASAPGRYAPCKNGAPAQEGSPLETGQTLTIGGAQAGQTLRVLHNGEAIYTITVG